MPVPWRYLLVGDTEDGAAALAVALTDAVATMLVRALPDSTIGYAVDRDGSWVHTDVLARIHFRGEILRTAETTVDDVRRVVRAWREAGRLDGEPSTDVDLPADLADFVERNARTADRAERLRTGPTLERSDVDRVRTALLAGAADLNPEWLADAGRVVRRVPCALPTDGPGLVAGPPGFVDLLAPA